ncbi:hypothetical protein HPB47_006905, partial [Ixodes persulcatus]
THRRTSRHRRTNGATQQRNTSRNMAGVFIQPPSGFEPNTENPAISWEEWRSCNLIYEAACKYAKKRKA